jgi:hypothetical protein
MFYLLNKKKENEETMPVAAPKFIPNRKLPDTSTLQYECTFEMYISLTADANFFSTSIVATCIRIEADMSTLTACALAEHAVGMVCTRAVRACRSTPARGWVTTDQRARSVARPRRQAGRVRFAMTSPPLLHTLCPVPTRHGIVYARVDGSRHVFLRVGDRNMA